MVMVSDNGGNYENPPAGLFNAVCYRVVDLGTHEGEYQGQKTIKRDIMISWEIDELMKDGKRFTVSSFYTASLNEKAKLRAMLESWRGRAFTEEELKGFNLENIIGKPCMVNLTMNDKGKIRVSGVSPLAKGMAPISPTNLLTHFDLEKFDAETFGLLSEGLRKKIMESPEYQHAVTGGNVAEAGNSASQELDDEIPF